nr:MULTISPECIES: transposase [Geobacillus]
MKSRTDATRFFSLSNCKLSLYFGINESFFCTFFQKALSPFLKECANLHHESAGKRLSGRTRKGNKKLRSCLVECARAAARTKNTYLSAKYHRIAKRRGANRASVAVGRTILERIDYILTRKEPYREWGADYWDRQREASLVRQTVKRLEEVGYEVKLEKNECIARMNHIYTGMPSFRS